ncbi:hypothetical protein VIN01S_14850 [Vibrio inusitatus NBRC 102082]|uniref:DUF1353 domain-containing protein n=1 Tax=Vibrio inusitatus NBRC 102082 TaxID=1219070 RepID=A0A4Y3HUN0_9VIBR|nr:DUF1353 domain-containing protein [Vibrio inusitatus]GEA50681.1 hypothetical protein VIN01S_14850 [Vibrio inusitatus NBRC 102082]
MSDTILYRSGYKYQLAEDFTINIDIFPGKTVDMEFIGLSLDGVLTVRSGYAWDGPSGPVVDTSRNMRASLVHDALYQILRCQHLPANQKEVADKLFEKICIDDGVDEFTAHMYYLGLMLGGKPATDPRNKKPTLKAPWR